MKKILAVTLLACLGINAITAQYNTYTQRFITMYDNMYKPGSGYFSTLDDGSPGLPYHSIETLMVEAPDYGHETTSEAISYWIWIDALYGGLTKNWTPLNHSINMMEKYTIPTTAMQPHVGDYNRMSPATYAGESPQPSDYPSALETNVQVGEDPISEDLKTTYGAPVYGMHWLFDLDNFYGFGNFGTKTPAGVTDYNKPSYMNNFQRGVQESVWECVPHPSWEDFSWGSNDGTGYLKLYVKENNAPAKQWRYTNAPDADARVIQAMTLAVEMAKEQNLDPKVVFPMDKISKLGDFIRLSFCDKYFKPIGCQTKTGAGGKGYESAHYLVSWYYAWGGPIESPGGWSWRIGSSHAHFGYQNPVCAYAMSQIPEFAPKSANGLRDWNTSLNRQVELYCWLQSATGAIAGGATNSYNGRYDAYPSGTPTFYGMAYQEHPVYHDPGSNQWFGMQAWSMQRIAELYYLSNDPRAKKLMDRWVKWVVPEVDFAADGKYFEIPATLVWSGKPDTWDPKNPSLNPGLTVSIKDKGQDLGVAGCLAKTLIYYAAAKKKYKEKDDFGAQKTAKELLDRMWLLYDGLGVVAEEKRGDFTERFFKNEVFVPANWTGKMPNGDVIKSGGSFYDIRTGYKNDRDFQKLKDAIANKEDYKTVFHRFWAQADIMLAYGEYGRFFGDSEADKPIMVTGVRMKPETVSIEKGEKFTLQPLVDPILAANKAVSWKSSNASVSVDKGIITGVSNGSAVVTCTTVDGSFQATCNVTVVNAGSIQRYVLNVNGLNGGKATYSPTPTNGGYANGTFVTVTAEANLGYYFNGWSGAAISKTASVTVKMDGNKTLTASFSSGSKACNNPSAVTLPLAQEGAGSYCWVVSETIDHVNSYNMVNLTINGVDFTNKWSNALPAAIDGKYYISYNGVSGSHFDIPRLTEQAINQQTPTSVNQKKEKSTVKMTIYPNPFTDVIYIDFADSEEVVKVELLDQTGRVLSILNASSINNTITLGSELKTGMYFVKVTTLTNEQVCKVIKQ